MCKCTPELRTPFCGEGDCVAPPQTSKPTQLAGQRTDVSEIKPCPFCGNIGVTFVVTQGTKWGNAECEHCGAAGPEVRTGYDMSDDAPWRDEAIEEWNTRYVGVD